MSTVTRHHIASRPFRREGTAWTAAALVLTVALVGVSTAAALASFFVPEVLRGPAVMNGSARGTALVMLLVGEPALIVSSYLALRGSLRARIVWLGTIGYFAYNGVMFVLGTPLNQAYLLYEAIIGLCVWSAVVAVHGVDMRELDTARLRGFPTRALAIYVFAIATLNAVVWLSGAVPAVLDPAHARVLEGTGLVTVPTYDQDLAFWIPFQFVAAVWTWRGIAWGRLMLGAVLAMGAIEGIGVAVDQWMGSAADPSSAVASAAMTPVFAFLAVTELVALFFFLRSIPRR
jgi:hypothetical protein